MKKINKKGFTLIEILIVVAIISILASVILVNMNQSKKNARINNTKTALKNAILIIYSCADTSSLVSTPANPESGSHVICPVAPNSYWPKLPAGYLYTGGSYNSISCSFGISTNGDSANLTCNCSSQTCN
jgi:prepilin-type N-terminal cleavage/methylation domain-containing protein